jgi:hypothetical protein
MARFALVGLAVLIILSLAALLVATQLANRAAVCDRAAAYVAGTLGAEVKCDSVRLAFFPLPHAAVDDVRFSLPGRVEAKVASVSVRPNWMALLRGRLQIAQIRVRSPDVVVYRARSTIPSPVSGPVNPAEEIHSALGSLLGAASTLAGSLVADAVLLVSDGRAELRVENGPVLSWKEIQAQISLPPHRLDVALQAASDLWEHISVEASLDAAAVQGSGHVEMSGLRLPPVMTALGVSDLRLDAPNLNVNAEFVLQSSPTLSLLRVNASAPTLKMNRGSEDVVVRDLHLVATATVGGETTDVRLETLAFDGPRVQLSGRASLAPDAVEVELRGVDLDVESVRDATMRAAGDVRLVRNIFSVLRSGTAPEITFRSRAPSFGGLGQDDAYVIAGRLVGGQVHVPGVELELSHVDGNATVAHDILVGEQVSAQLGRSRAMEGRLRLGLGSGEHPLSVETRLEADAAEIATFLGRTVKNESFQREFARVRNVTGALIGRLLVEGTTKQPTVTAETSSFDLTGNLQGIAAPLQLKGGLFRFDPTGISLREVTLAAGSSELTNITMRIPRSQRAPSFEATAGTSRIVLNEAYSWLASAQWLPRSPWCPKAVNGTVSLKSARVTGPLAKPADWQIKVRGAVRDFTIDLPKWQARIAREYPVSLSDLGLTYDTRSGVSLVTQVSAPGQTSGAIDLTWNGERLHIKHLRVQDRESDASLALLFTTGNAELSFQGKLRKGTVDRLIQHDFDVRSIDGDLSARIPLDQPERALLEGRLEVSDVTLPIARSEILRVPHAAFRAADGLIWLNAVLGLGSDSVNLTGQVSQSRDAVAADLDLTAEHIHWNEIEPFLRRDDKSEELPEKDARKPRLRGTIRIAAGAFTFGRFTWHGVRGVADVAEHKFTLSVADATVCGIATPGTITADPNDLTLDFRPVAKEQSLGTLISCMGIEREFATGQYNLNGDFAARGAPSNLMQSVRGQFEFTAAKGRIHGMGLTARLLSVLSVATGSVRSLPNISKEGLPYDRIMIKADVKGSKLRIQQAILDGPSVTWAAEGSADLTARTLDLTFLLAPLTTADTALARIPVLGFLLGGNLVTFPVRVTGQFGNPTINPLSPSAVGQSLLRTMTRTLELPRVVIQPFLPKAEKE